MNKRMEVKIKREKKSNYTRLSPSVDFFFYSLRPNQQFFSNVGACLPEVEPELSKD